MCSTGCASAPRTGREPDIGCKGSCTSRAAADAASAPLRCPPTSRSRSRRPTRAPGWEPSPNCGRERWARPAGRARCLPAAGRRRRCRYPARRRRRGRRGPRGGPRHAAPVVVSASSASTVARIRSRTTWRCRDRPLATSVSVDVSDAWIRVVEAAGGYDVSLGAPVRGAVSGEVVLRGAAGEQRVQVRAEGRPTSLPRPARPPDVAVAPPSEAQPVTAGRGMDVPAATTPAATTPAATTPAATAPASAPFFVDRPWSGAGLVDRPGSGAGARRPPRRPRPGPRPAPRPTVHARYRSSSEG